ncbi:MAG TPA: hypothetical protein VK154_17055 [Chitinophagales bacterium]|nr:hypothetical protein [Chitinophagales bacterium]
MISSKGFIAQYGSKAYVVFGVLLLVVIGRLTALAGFSYMPPVIPAGESETVYHWLNMLGLPQLVLTNRFLPVVFDVLLVLLPVLFVFTLKRGFAIGFFFLLLLYFFTYNIVTGHHYHGLVGAVLIVIPFFTKNETRFNLLWDAVRYYWLYIFASAALWKILRGTVFYTDQLSNILKAQQLDLLVQQPNSPQAQMVQYLIANPSVSHAVLVVNVLVQATFLIGFFTKRFDTALSTLAIVFCIANYFVMNIVSAELLILNLTLVNWDELELKLDKFRKQRE